MINTNHKIDSNRHCTVHGVILYCPLADLWLPAVKRYQFQHKVFVALVCLNSNHMFGSSTFWDKSPSWLLKKLKLPSSFYKRVILIFLNVIEQFIPVRPPKHMITSTNLTVLFKSSRHHPGQREKPNLDFFFHFFEVPQKALWRP